MERRKPGGLAEEGNLSVCPPPSPNCCNLAKRFPTSSSLQPASHFRGEEGGEGGVHSCWTSSGLSLESQLGRGQREGFKSVANREIFHLEEESVLTFLKSKDFALSSKASQCNRLSISSFTLRSAPAFATDRSPAPAPRADLSEPCALRTCGEMVSASSFSQLLLLVCETDRARGGNAPPGCPLRRCTFERRSVREGNWSEGMKATPPPQRTSEAA